eukprot:861411-Prymnesium_polylepis.1
MPSRHLQAQRAPLLLAGVLPIQIPEGAEGKEDHESRQAQFERQSAEAPLLRQLLSTGGRR